jgi:nicotinate phosphoribosyltransferase
LGSVYKLVAEGGEPKIKLSTGKATLPGRKQLFRFFDGGRFVRDVISLEEEEAEGATPLLECVMARGGRRMAARSSLEDIKRRCRGRVEQLPERLRSLEGGGAPYEVHTSPGLRALVDEMQRRDGGSVES